MNRDTFWRRLTEGVHRGRARADWTVFAGADWLERIMGQPVTDRFTDTGSRP